MAFEDALGKLNADYFFREFTFSSNKFKPNPNEELELADNVVWLDDLMIVYQVKERNAPVDTTPEREKKWFDSEVVTHASSQIRDTLAYLKTYPEIELLNRRGHAFNVTTAKVSSLHNLIVYHPHISLSAECIAKKHHWSKTAQAFIHLIPSGDYQGILETLVTPVEIGEYLSYRQSLIENWGESALVKVSEKAVVGHYLRNLSELEPTSEFEVLVDKLEQQDPDKVWSLAPIINRYLERRNTPDSPLEASYAVLKTLAKLYRTEMDEFKKRFRLSMDKALADERFMPNRFCNSKGSGFVFIPLLRKDLPHRLNILFNLTVLNKYDLRLDKCIGMTFIADTDDGSIDVQWCPVESPWQENPKLQAELDRHYPFRPVKSAKIDRYKLSDDEPFGT